MSLLYKYAKKDYLLGHVRNLLLKGVQYILSIEEFISLPTLQMFNHQLKGHGTCGPILGDQSSITRLGLQIRKTKL